MSVPSCGGPDRCFDDLCHGRDEGLCGLLSENALRSLGVYVDEPDDEYPDDDPPF